MDEMDCKCLADLRVTDPRDDKVRIEQAKGGLLKEAYRWVLTTSEFRQWRNDEQIRLLWVKGDPGKGKTMLLCGIAEELQNTASKTNLVSYFFCQATEPRINNATAVLRGLIYMMVVQQPMLISHIRKKYDLAGKQLFEDGNALTTLEAILSSMLEDPKLQSSYILIDALDECMTDLSPLLKLIQSLAAKSSTKWIVSSRNWQIIDKWLNKTTQKVRLCLELNEESVSTAVGAYITSQVDQLAEKNDYDSDTQVTVQNYLSSKAQGTFLWVALVCQELADTSGWKARKRLTAFPPGLDALYRRMIDQICSSEDASLCIRILAVVSTTYQPLTLDELASFIDLPDGVSPTQYKILVEIISLCGSFLTLRKRTIFFVHQSAKDFLIEKAVHDVFPSGIQDLHYTIFSQSLKVMSKILRRDIYKLQAPGFPISKVKQPSPDPLAIAQYACIYWIDHLYDCSSIPDVEKDLQDGGLVDTFLRQKYLYWLEALSLLESLWRGVLSMMKLEGLLQVR